MLAQVRIAAFPAHAVFVIVRLQLRRLDALPSLPGPALQPAAPGAVEGIGVPGIPVVERIDVGVPRVQPAVGVHVAEHQCRALPGPDAVGALVIAGLADAAGVVAVGLRLALLLLPDPFALRLLPAADLAALEGGKGARHSVALRAQALAVADTDPAVRVHQMARVVVYVSAKGAHARSVVVDVGVQLPLAVLLEVRAGIPANDGPAGVAGLDLRTVEVAAPVAGGRVGGVRHMAVPVLQVLVGDTGVLVGALIAAGRAIAVSVKHMGHRLARDLIPARTVDVEIAHFADLHIRGVDLIGIMAALRRVKAGLSGGVRVAAGIGIAVGAGLAAFLAGALRGKDVLSRGDRLRTPG